MFFSQASIAAALLGLAQANKLNFTVVQPALLEPGWVPESCFQGVYLENIQGRDIDVYNVTFPECDEPFIVCRHKSSKASPDMIFSGLSRLSGRMRQWVGNFVAMPTIKPDFAACSAPAPWAAPTTGLTQSVWRDRFEEDRHVATDYATTNYIEAFAETAVLKAYDLFVPGGLAKLPQDSALVNSQLNMMNVIFSDFMLPRCNAKVPSSPMVAVPVIKRRRSTRKRAISMPDVTVSRVPEIKIAKELYEMPPHAEEAFGMRL